MMKTWFVVLLLLSVMAEAEVRLPSLIGDHMVLQRDVPIRLWGWAAPGEEITVTARDQRAAAVTDADGCWAVQLAPMAATSEPFTIVFAGANRIEIENVVVGEVWICTGQSNMGTPMRIAADVDDILAAADKPAIRLFRVPNAGGGRPADDVDGQWAVSTTEQARIFAAVAYVFGFELHAALEVPIGLIQSQWGGTPVEAWIPREFMQTPPDLRETLDAFETDADATTPGWREPERFRELLDQSTADHQEWGRTLRRYQAALAAGEKVARPTRERSSAIHKGAPTVLYNGMIAPLTPLAIRGAIWYQGEASRGQGFAYRHGLRQMIAGWRANWAIGDFPFLVVQLPANGEPSTDPGAATGWVELRGAQWVQPQYLPGVAVTVNYDVNPDGNLHPREKRPIGQRLALAALGMVYGREVAWRSPSAAAFEFADSRARVTFRDVGEGLRTRDGEAPSGFALAGEDGVFVWAEARLDGPDAVVVQAPGVAAPTVVRYAWVENPVTANLINAAGLPAAPFRSDAPPLD